MIDTDHIGKLNKVSNLYKIGNLLDTFCLLLRLLCVWLIYRGTCEGLRVASSLARWVIETWKAL